MRDLSNNHTLMPQSKRNNKMISGTLQKMRNNHYKELVTFIRGSNKSKVTLNSNLNMEGSTAFFSQNIFFHLLSTALFMIALTALFEPLKFEFCSVIKDRDIMFGDMFAH